MDVLFGDASTVVGTPSVRAETDSLMPSGSPFTSTSAIPGMSLDRPDTEGNDGKPSTPGGGEPPTVGSWLARVVNRSRSRASSRGSGAGSGRYAPLRQNEEGRGERGE